tara:strand:- start:173 stop:442 length:270 start_codon:yes stop_codon:yes gene_type:complete
MGTLLALGHYLLQKQFISLPTREGQVKLGLDSEAQAAAATAAVASKTDFREPLALAVAVETVVLRQNLALGQPTAAVSVLSLAKQPKTA